MDQTFLLALAVPIVGGIITATLTALLLWAVIRSAVLSALRKHDLEYSPRQHAAPQRPITPYRAEPGPRDW